VWLECRSKFIGSYSPTWPKTIGPRQDSRLMDPVSGPKALGSSGKTQGWWVLHEDPRLIGLVSGPKVLGLRFLNIIFCIINIFIYIIIKSINIKNIVICIINIIIFVLIKSINIKNIIISIIINIINKIINKFEKYYYQYWNTTIDLIWSVK